MLGLLSHARTSLAALSSSEPARVSAKPTIVQMLLSVDPAAGLAHAMAAAVAAPEVPANTAHILSKFPQRSHMYIFASNKTQTSK
ncbi:hypothetical protein PWT90_02690 [Aphanocladium album]|nr:hypothetical protein PWT90_02690 [Aphanocladium album]